MNAKSGISKSVSPQVTDVAKLHRATGADPEVKRWGLSPTH
jgi:hypothetical protein